MIFTLASVSLAQSKGTCYPVFAAWQSAFNSTPELGPRPLLVIEEHSPCDAWDEGKQPAPLFASDGVVEILHDIAGPTGLVVSRSTGVQVLVVSPDPVWNRTVRMDATHCPSMGAAWTLKEARRCFVRQVTDLYVADPFEPVADHLMVEPTALPTSMPLLDALLAADEAAGMVTERIAIRTRVTLNGARSVTLFDRGAVTERATWQPGYGPPARPEENEIPNAPPLFPVPALP